MQVSVLLPVHRIDSFFNIALRTTLVALPLESEVLVIVNGEARQSLNDLVRHWVDDPRVRILETEDTGIVAALNFGLKNARGLYVARMDSDDVMHPLRLSRQVEYMNRHPKVGVLGTQMRIVCHHGNVIQNETHLPGRVGTWGLPSLRPQIAHPTVMMRHQVLRSVGGYSDEYPAIEDFALWTKLLGRTQIRNLKHIGLDYRIHNNQISKKFTLLQQSSTRRLITDYWDVRRSYSRWPAQAKLLKRLFLRCLIFQEEIVNRDISTIIKCAIRLPDAFLIVSIINIPTLWRRMTSRRHFYCTSCLPRQKLPALRN